MGSGGGGGPRRKDQHVGRDFVHDDWRREGGGVDSILSSPLMPNPTIIKELRRSRLGSRYINHYTYCVPVCQKAIIESLLADTRIKDFEEKSV